MTPVATAPNFTISTDEPLNRMPTLTEQERWLLRLARAGIIDTSDLAHHTGLSAAQVQGALSSAIHKLGADTLMEAVDATEALASNAQRSRP